MGDIKVVSSGGGMNYSITLLMVNAKINRKSFSVTDITWQNIHKEEDMLSLLVSHHCGKRCPTQMETIREDLRVVSRPHNATGTKIMRSGEASS